MSEQILLIQGGLIYLKVKNAKFLDHNFSIKPVVSVEH